MDKKPLIVVNILAVVLLVLGSMSNVVGYQSVQTSQQNIIKERINQRELLFQTITDLINNKEIQRIILKYQINRGIFPTLEIPVITKNQIRQMYFLGLFFSKSVSTSRMKSIMTENPFDYQQIKNEISSVIEKNSVFCEDLFQLNISECNCENDKTVLWHFPVICSILFDIFYFGVILLYGSGGIYGLYQILFLIAMGIMVFTAAIAEILHCEVLGEKVK